MEAVYRRAAFELCDTIAHVDCIWSLLCSVFGIHKTVDWSADNKIKGESEKNKEQDRQYIKCRTLGFIQLRERFV